MRWSVSYQYVAPLLALMLALMLALLLAGCSSKSAVEGALVQPARGGADKAARFLAYEHALQLETEQDKVAALFQAGQAACRDAAVDACVVLESRLTTGNQAYAALKLRARPAGIAKLIAALGKQSTITEQSTVAEDLAAPVADTEKKLAMLTDYRTKLEALRGRAGSDVDALIKVTRELAQVQNDIESISGQRAQLMQRVDTELLSVTIRSSQQQGFWSPVALAGKDFGANLAQGVAGAITGLAYLLPWLAMLLLIGWGGRKLLWRLRKRAAKAGASA
jgi:hypothetical protein